MRFRTIIAVAAVPAATAGLLLTTTAAASAATVTPAVTTATAVTHQTSWTAISHLADRTEDGGNGTWAKDDIYRVMTIKLTGQSGGLYSYTATVYDAGSFTAIPGAHTPNQGGSYAGKVIAGHDSGWVGGTARYSFTATSLPTAGPNAGLPAYVNGDQGSTSTWYELAFPAGTTFGGTGIGTWGWTYSDSHGQRWTDTSANGDGQLSGDGNIA
jgi:hypothetical protein